MTTTLSWIIRLIFLVAGLWMVYFAWVSWKEQEDRALRLSAGAAAGCALLVIISYNFTDLIILAIFYTILVLGAGSLVLFLLPIGKLPPDKPQPRARFDEREIVFARARLQPGTPQYADYYRRHPDHKAPDDRTRARPGLLSLAARHANPYAFGSATASFGLIDAIHGKVEGPPAPTKAPLTPEQASALVKGLAHYYGALHVGITRLQPYHVYSHIGRGPGEYGAEIPLEHAYAIAFTVEMDFKMVAQAPTAPVVMESSRQYVEAAKVAAQLAEALRQLGYPARAHIDANYRVICPLVGRDAGLGEIGRMSILMTPSHGPRVRLGVVTTDLALVPDPASPRMDIIDFCMVCKKCAENCPSRAISLGDRQEEGGIRRWVLNAETCFAYWNEIGTDCAICMRVCPYSHPDNLAHNLVRWGTARSGLFRRAAVWLDDLFYGRRPADKTAPDWLPD